VLAEKRLLAGYLNNEDRRLKEHRGTRRRKEGLDGQPYYLARAFFAAATTQFNRYELVLYSTQMAQLQETRMYISEEESRTEQ
jgi:hypothetical protein